MPLTSATALRAPGGSSDGSAVVPTEAVCERANAAGEVAAVIAAPIELDMNFRRSNSVTRARNHDIF